MKQLIFLSILLFLFSCSADDKSNYSKRPKEKQHPTDIVLANDTVLVYPSDSLISHEGDSLSGTVIVQKSYQKELVKYEDGWITSVKGFKSDTILTCEIKYNKGKLHGTYKEWYDDGTLKLKGYYTEGKADSTWSYYYQNGKLDTRGSYAPEVQIEDFMQRLKKRDLRIGENTIIETSFNSHSAPDGEWEFYSTSGKLIKTLTFDKGTIVELEFGSFDN